VDGQPVTHQYCTALTIFSLPRRSHAALRSLSRDAGQGAAFRRRAGPPPVTPGDRPADRTRRVLDPDVGATPALSRHSIAPAATPEPSARTRTGEPLRQYCAESALSLCHLLHALTEASTSSGRIGFRCASSTQMAIRCAVQVLGMPSRHASSRMATVSGASGEG